VQEVVHKTSLEEGIKKECLLPSIGCRKTGTKRRFVLTAFKAYRCGKGNGCMLDAVFVGILKQNQKEKENVYGA
jgi:hypothetical protein